MWPTNLGPPLFRKALVSLRNRRCLTSTFMVAGSQFDALLELLDRPAEDNAGLRDLFSTPAPWDAR